MIGQTVSHYRILSSLGHGGFGVVYEAEDTHLGRRVAIKFSTATPENAPYRARFLREARAASALNHPNIAGIYDYGETVEGQPFIVMELVSGTDLHKLVRGGTLKIAQILDITAGVAAALVEAHRRGVLHRDIKPANIVITPENEVKVLDFGLAKQIEPSSPESGSSGSPMLTSDTMEGQVLGTPAYMSPEQVRDEPLGPASDLFALGSVLYECLTGRAPFSGKNPVDVLASVLHVQPPPPSERNPRVSPALDALTMKLLAKDRAARYQSADQLLTDIRALRDTLSDSETQETLEISPSAARAVHSTASTFATAITKTLATLGVPLRRSRLAVAVILVAVVALALWMFLPGQSYQPAPDALRWYDEGVSALRDGTYYKASLALQRAVSRDSQFSMAHARLAEAWLELDYGDKAKEEMLRAVPPGAKPRLSRSDEDYEQAIGMTLTGDLAGAIQKYRDIVSRAPEAAKASAWMELGRAYERKEDAKNALACYQEAARLQPQNPAAQLRLGIQYARQFDQTRAARAFQEADSIYRGLSNFEGVAEVQYQSAILANRLNKVKESRALLQLALEMAQHIGSVSQQIVALIQLSNVDQNLNDSALAEQDATRAIELARANGLETLTMRGLIDLGNALFTRGEIEPARKYYQQSLEYAQRYHAERSEARAMLSLGSLETQHGEIDAGTPHVQQALAWYRKHSAQRETIQALSLLARAQRQKGDYAGAMESFQQQQQLSKQLGLELQSALAYQGIGSILIAQGRWPEALAAYRQEYEATSLSNAEFNVQYSLVDQASVLWSLGRYREAEQFLDRLGPHPLPALVNEAARVRAEIALSQRQFAAAAAQSRAILAKADLNAGLEIEMKLVLGKALLRSGSRAQGLASIEDALALAQKGNQVSMTAQAGLAKAEAWQGSAFPALGLELVLSAQRFYASAGNSEGEWRCWLAAARLSESPRESAQKAAAALAQLQRKWDAESFAGYSRRPDVQYDRAQLQKLLGKN